jgi:hypothetical protein
MNTLNSLSNDLGQLIQEAQAWKDEVDLALQDEAKFRKRGNTQAGIRVRRLLLKVSKGASSIRKTLLLRAREMEIFKGTPRQASYKPSKHTKNGSTPADSIAPLEL